jgi:hypothetical protein
MDPLHGVTAENVENLGEIEKQWAVKALEHAETYYKLICEVQPSTLRLTRVDDDLYEDFRKTFPDMDIKKLAPSDINATESIKSIWRSFIMPYETRIAHYNFGSLIRLDSSQDYTEQNSYFVTRTQFYAIEIARNREGCNDIVYQQYQEAKKSRI